MANLLAFTFRKGMQNVPDKENLDNNAAELIQNMKMDIDGTWRALSSAEFLELAGSGNTPPETIFENWVKCYQVFPAYTPMGCIDNYYFIVFYTNGTCKMVWRGTADGAIVIDIDEFWFNSLVDHRSYATNSSGVSTPKYAIEGFYLTNNITITTPVITYEGSDYDFFYIREYGLDTPLDWVHELVLTPDVNGHVESDIEMSFLPTIVVDNMTGNIDNESGTITTPVTVHGTSYDFMLKDYLMWRLEALDDDDLSKYTVSGDKITTWSSITPAVDFTPIPETGQTQSNYRPDSKTMKLLSASVDTVVAEFNTTTKIRNLHRKIYDTMSGIYTGHPDGYDGITFACVFDVSQLSSVGSGSHYFAHYNAVMASSSIHQEWSVYSYGENFNNIIFGIRTVRDGSVAAATATVSLGFNLRDYANKPKVCLLMVVFDPASGFATQNIKVYLGIRNTIHQYSAQLFTGDSWAMLADSSLEVHACIGCYHGAVSEGYTSIVNYSLEGQQATNVAWRHKFSTADVREAFDWYKRRYPYVFTYNNTIE